MSLLVINPCEADLQVCRVEMETGDVSTTHVADILGELDRSLPLLEIVLPVPHADVEQWADERNVQVTRHECANDTTAKALARDYVHALNLLPRFPLLWQDD